MKKKDKEMEQKVMEEKDMQDKSGEQGDRRGKLLCYTRGWCVGTLLSLSSLGSNRSMSLILLYFIIRLHLGDISRLIKALGNCYVLGLLYISAHIAMFIYAFIVPEIRGGQNIFLCFSSFHVAYLFIQHTIEYATEMGLMLFWPSPHQYECLSTKRCSHDFR